MTQLSFSNPSGPNPSGRGPFAFAESIKTPRSPASTWTAVGAHAAAILLLIAFASRVNKTLNPTTQFPPAIALPDPVLPMLHHVDSGASGGSGSNNTAAPVHLGQPPRAADIQMLTTAEPPKITPVLAVPPSVNVPDMTSASAPILNLGSTNSTVRIGGLGKNGGTGVGDNGGPGAGIGGPGVGSDGFTHVGLPGVRAPVLTYEVQPDFSEEARKSKFSGNVQVYLIVDEQGRPTHVRVARGVGMGLDEKAVEAVRQYKFKPAMQNGKPVKVDLYIDVNFRIF